MKKIMMTTLTFMTALQLHAQTVEKNVVEIEKEIKIELNSISVKCAPPISFFADDELRLEIPAMATNSALNIKKSMFIGPYVYAGACPFSGDESRFKILIDTSQPTENVKLHIKQYENFTLREGRCIHSYNETYTTVVRGISFTGHKTMRLADLNPSTCLNN